MNCTQTLCCLANTQRQQQFSEPGKLYVQPSCRPSYIVPFCAESKLKVSLIWCLIFGHHSFYHSHQCIGVPFCQPDHMQVNRRSKQTFSVIYILIIEFIIRLINWGYSVPGLFCTARQMQQDLPYGTKQPQLSQPLLHYNQTQQRF